MTWTASNLPEPTCRPCNITAFLPRAWRTVPERRQRALNQTLVLLLIVIAIQLFAPDEYKPSRLLGKAAGDFDAAATTAQTAEQAELERQLAEAQTEADRATRPMKRSFQVTAKAMETIGQWDWLSMRLSKRHHQRPANEGGRRPIFRFGLQAPLFPKLSMLLRPRRPVA